MIIRLNGDIIINTENIKYIKRLSDKSWNVYFIGDSHPMDMTQTEIDKLLETIE